MLEWLTALGAATWATVWIPVAVWTLTALVLRAVLTRASTLHPQTQYSARLALLASLPVGVGLTWLLPPLLPAAWLPNAWWSTNPPAPAAEPLLLLPPQQLAPIAVQPAEPLSLPLLLVGTLTAVAAMSALIWTVRLLRDMRAVRQLRQRLTPHPAPQLQATVAELTRTLGIRRPVEARTSPEVPVPLTCGTWRPLVVLPRRLAPDEQRLALLHELVHVRRYDYLLHLVSRMLVAVCAVHPLIHRLYDEACTYREVANDDAVLRQPGVDRRPYASLLLRFADAPTHHWAAALSFAQPIASLKDRIHAMSQPSAPNRPRPIFTLLLTLLLVGIIGTFMACSDMAVDTPDTTEEAALPSLEDATIVEVTETMPQPVGGMGALAANIRYTDEAKGAGIEGRVIVRFVVDAEGNVRNPEVVRGLGAGLDEAAVAALEATDWKAGEQNGEPVHVRMVFPVTFRLSGAEGASQAPPPPTPPTPTEGNVSSDADVMSQPPPPPPTEGGTFTVVEEMPAPVGGAASMQERITYPDMAKRAGIEGRVVVQFVVDTDGTPRDLQVVRGIGGGADEEALRVIRETKFTPGTQRGQAVPVRLSWPVTFRLPDTEGATSSRQTVPDLRVEGAGGRLADLSPEAIQTIDVRRSASGDPTITIALKEGMALDFFDGETFEHSSSGDVQPTTVIIRRG
jgi:TonB family protein